MKYSGNIILAAHRGDKKCFPENTIPAFESAIRFGADMIETDIHMTRDGKLVIIHDRNTRRTTNYNGYTNEMNFEEIKKLDAGSWFSDEFANVQVPSVKEFIELIKDTDMLVNWELKDYPCEVGEEFAFRSADKLIELIEENGLTDRSMINSFSDCVLEHVYLKYGNRFSIHGQGIHNCQNTIDKASVSQTELYDWCCLYPNIPNARPMDFPENFEYCIANGILPCVCVSDTLESYDKYIKLGCKMFTSNDIYEGDKILRMLNVR